MWGQTGDFGHLGHGASVTNWNRLIFRHDLNSFWAPDGHLLVMRSKTCIMTNW
jgi:hypothetical protein